MLLLRSFVAFSQGGRLDEPRHRGPKSEGHGNLSASKDRIEVREADRLITDGHLPYPYGREMTV